MKIASIKLLLIIFFSIQIFLVNSIYAIEIKDRFEYLLDVRDDDGDIYLNRLSLHKKFESSDIEAAFFGEVQYNLEIDDWEKLMLGIEIGKYPYKYLYIGQSLQLTSCQMLDYMAFDTNSKTVDTTTKIGLCVPFLEYFSLHIFEEYTLNIEKGRDEYCETGTEIIYRPKNLYSISIGWRHTDRIHALDTDYISSSFTLHL